MSEQTSDQILESFEWAMKEVHRRYAAGELDMSGRYYTDEELREMAKTWGKKDKPEAA